MIFSARSRILKLVLMACTVLGVAIASSCSPQRSTLPDTATPTRYVASEPASCVPGTSGKATSSALPTCEPGLVLRGCVHLADGTALEGVEIYRGFASYEAVLVATTGAEGCYQSDFQFIPGDEMVNVYAQKDGYTFEPASVSWRHYYGYEPKTIDFTASKTQ